MVGRKSVRTTATMATVKVEFGVVTYSEDGHNGVLAINSRGRIGPLMSWGAGSHIDMLKLLTKTLSREMPRYKHDQRNRIVTNTIHVTSAVSKVHLYVFMNLYPCG